MKIFSILLIVSASILINGCKSSSNPLQGANADPHPTQIVSFDVGGNKFTGDSAIAVVSVNDTVAVRIVAVDQDKIASYTLYEEGKFNGRVGPFGQPDTMTANFAFIGDTTKYFKVGSLVQFEVVWQDLLGFTKSQIIQVYYAK